MCGVWCLALGWGMGTRPAQERAALLPPPLAPGTRGGSWREGLHNNSCSNCFAPKNDGLSLGCSDFVFSSFPSAVNTTSGFEIKGDTRTDEFTARCWLLECTTVRLIQSTRNRRAPPPPLGLGHHMMSLPPARSLQKQSPAQPPDLGWKRTGWVESQGHGR